MKSRVYFDTSAYLGILLGEKAAKAFKKESAQWILCSSSLMLLESERNLVRLSREKLISAKVYEKAMDRLRIDMEFFILKDFTTDLCLNGSFPAVQTPRSLDLAHIRTAQWFALNGGLSAFVTLDSRQAAAARDVGIPLWTLTR